ncbi:ABC transporter permease, partial [Streptomyces sp. 4F]
MRRFAAGATRTVSLLAVLAAVGLLPWLSGRDPALTVLRARSAEQEPTEEALSAIRRDLGLDAGPLSLLGDWAAGLVRGDLGTSWVSGMDILPSVVSGLQVSLGLMAAALTVAVLLAVALVTPVLVRGRESAGAFAAMAAA